MRLLRDWFLIVAIIGGTQTAQGQDITAIYNQLVLLNSNLANATSLISQEGNTFSALWNNSNTIAENGIDKFASKVSPLNIFALSLIGGAGFGLTFFAVTQTLKLIKGKIFKKRAVEFSQL